MERQGIVGSTSESERAKGNKRVEPNDIFGNILDRGEGRRKSSSDVELTSDFEGLFCFQPLVATMSDTSLPKASTNEYQTVDILTTAPREQGV